MAGSPEVVYCCSKQYLDVCCLPSKIKGRALYVHKLLDAYGLLGKLRLESPAPLSTESLQLFHCKDYITCIQKVQDMLKGRECLDDDHDDLYELAELELDIHGLAYDCMPFSRILDYIALVAGASVKCAELLNKGEAQIAINLFGGWHHAHRDSAAGFCYVNDIVLAILKLKEEFNRVLYIDIDIHHGDGVEEAFLTTDKVMTVSFHKLEDGYFPGSGKISNVGYGRGKFHSVNVPLKDGINDQQYFDVFSRTMDRVKEAFQPKVVVYQCGADCIAGDPLGGFNLTSSGFVKCVKYIADWKLPLLILGGGGYNFVNTAKVWTSMIAAIVEKELPNDIPDHEFFSDYGPFFDLNITPSIRKSQNSNEYLDGIVDKVTENLKHVKRRSPLKHIQPITKIAKRENKDTQLTKYKMQKKTSVSSRCLKRTCFDGTHDENDIGLPHGVTDPGPNLTKKAKGSIKTENISENNGCITTSTLVGKDSRNTFEFDEDF